MPGRPKKLTFEDSSDSSSYEVQKILQKKIKHGKQLYKVVWKGYPVSQATWQPRTNMINCSQLILQFQLNLLSEQDKAQMNNPSLLTKEDMKDQVQNMPTNIYESNILAVSLIPPLEHLKRLTSVVDKLIRKQSQLPQHSTIQEVLEAQKINQNNQPSWYKVRVKNDERYYKVARSYMLKTVDKRVKLIEYYQRLGWKH